MPDDNRMPLTDVTTTPSLAERKTRIVASWVRFAKTLCRGHAAFVMDTSGGRARITFIDGQADLLEAADTVAEALSASETFAVSQLPAAATGRARDRAAVVGVRVSDSKALCIVVEPARVSQIEDRRIGALCAVARLCGSVLAFSPPPPGEREFRARRGAGRHAGVGGKNLAY